MVSQVETKVTCASFTLADGALLSACRRKLLQVA